MAVQPQGIRQVKDQRRRGYHRRCGAQPDDGGQQRHGHQGKAEAAANLEKRADKEGQEQAHNWKDNRSPCSGVRLHALL